MTFSGDMSANQINKQTCSSVQVAVAVLIDTELWGFVTPESVVVADVIAATQKVQPYYAVPTRFKILSELPHTRFVQSASKF